MQPPTITPKQRVRVLQSVKTRTGDWTIPIEGEVLLYAPDSTGSWFTHGKNDRLWLQRLRLRRDDGEIIDLIIDENSTIQVI